MIRRVRPSLQLAFGLTVLFLLTSFIGCGYKDKPIAPSQIVPVAVTDLQYQLDEKGVTLYWSYPNKTVTGTKVVDIASFDLYRAVVAVDEHCETCPIPFASPIDVPGGALPDNGARSTSYQMTVLRPGHLYFFKVRSRTGWWSESEDSNMVSFLWNTPPMAPEGLSVKAGDGRTVLAWQPVQRRQDASQLAETVTYQVLRSVDGGVFAKVGESVATTSYSDTQVENGRTYAYQVQAVSVFKQGQVAGGTSETVEATPLDLTPPPPPRNLQGIRTDVGVKVYWDQVEAGDLTGYRVYRRAAGADKSQLVGTVHLPYNLFVDKKAAENTQYFYSVTSIDGQNPANESARTPEVAVGD
ncbi:MAG: hypothetical protein RBT36_03775 [Desulfobulbus sp.]|jgi:hypothetical protein|nr:hypothetical protein [Desulfobulbus sp.]